VPEECNGEPPPCLLEFTDQLVETMWSGERTEMEEIWRWASDVDMIDVLDTGPTRLSTVMDCIRGREVSGVLRVMASFLYAN
jgi:hypothetical protein